MSWILYIQFNHYLIKMLYENNNIEILNKILAGREFTPLNDYYQEADKLMVITTFLVIISFSSLALLLINPLGLTLSCCSCLLSFSLLFFTLELFPSLIDLRQLSFLDYYAYRANYLPDKTLVYREKPLSVNRILNFRGHNYSPIYNIDAVPRNIDWITDEDGFRNTHTDKFTDIEIIGDSFIEYGDNESDTFGRMLEKKLPGLTVTNLGKAGYGPFQYLEVLKRYGINKKPKYILLGLFEGNDLDDIQEYLEWQNGDERDNSQRIFYVEVYRALTGSLYERYSLALISALRYVNNQFSLLKNLSISKLWQMRGFIHPEVSVLEVGNVKYKMLFRDIGWSRNIVKTPGELLTTDKMKKLRDILYEFKNICEQNNIIPIVLYIPNRTHIYAQYSTSESGSTWLSLWQARVRNKKNIEYAIVTLLGDLHLELINLSTVFERAASDGKMLYYSLDSHWNAEGREVAAASVAEILKAKFREPTSGRMKR